MLVVSLPIIPRAFHCIINLRIYRGAISLVTCVKQHTRIASLYLREWILIAQMKIFIQHIPIGLRWMHRVNHISRATYTSLASTDPITTSTFRLSSQKLPRFITRKVLLIIVGVDWVATRFVTATTVKRVS